MFINNEQLTEVNALRDTFPYRITYIAYRSGEWVYSAVTTKRIPNQLAREGYRVWLLSGRGSLVSTPCALCKSADHSVRNHLDLDIWQNLGGTLD